MTEDKFKSVTDEQPRIRRKNARHYEERPDSLEIETDFTNTETKLVVIDFLSSQPTEHLTARNAKRKVHFQTNERRSLEKSSSDASSHELYRSRYAKLAKSGRSLRKQYSLRLQKDLEQYLKLRGRSMDDISEPMRESAVHTYHDDTMVNLHQRSYTEGDVICRSEGGTGTEVKKPRRKISRELKDGITEFDIQTLRHVEVKKNTEKSRKRSKEQRPANLEMPIHPERKLSPVLSPESQVAARLEVISQEILQKYPEIFNDQISQVNLEELTYEKFASIAESVLEKHPGGWTRIALVCYFARELALEDESSDEKLETLVNFSARFISDTSAKWIASQGGWGALEDADSKNLNPSKVRQKLKEQPDLVDGLLDIASNVPWFNKIKLYAFAALGVGATVALYSMTK